MGAAEHRISRVVFALDASEEAALTAFNDAVRASFATLVEPALAAALDRVDRGSSVLRFDRLEIDLGTLDASAPSANLLARRIAEGVGAALAAAATSDDHGAASAVGPADDLALFLETGEVLWSRPGRALATLVAAVSALDAREMAGLAARLRPVLTRSGAAERLLRQLPAPVVRRLVHALLASAAAPAERHAQTLSETGPPAYVPDGSVAALAAAIRGLARGAAKVDPHAAAALLAALAGRAADGLEPVDAEGSPVTPLVADDGAADAAALIAARPVHAAGSVLLYPYLAALFERVGLSEVPGVFRDEAARSRAVLLAHHLATGEEEAPEAQTVLFKLLCGMDPARSLPRRIDPTPPELREVDALLRSVIRHWGRLGATSPDGLREGFLMRPGQLQGRRAPLRLQVERRGIDVLLDGLPWALSMVRTPYMRDVLIVDWRGSR